MDQAAYCNTCSRLLHQLWSRRISPKPHAFGHASDEGPSYNLKIGSQAWYSEVMSHAQQHHCRSHKSTKIHKLSPSGCGVCLFLKELRRTSPRENKLWFKSKGTVAGSLSRTDPNRISLAQILGSRQAKNSIRSSVYILWKVCTFRRMTKCHKALQFKTPGLKSSWNDQIVDLYPRRLHRLQVVGVLLNRLKLLHRQASVLRAFASWQAHEKFTKSIPNHPQTVLDMPLSFVKVRC